MTDENKDLNDSQAAQDAKAAQDTKDTENTQEQGTTAQEQDAATQEQATAQEQDAAEDATKEVILQDVDIEKEVDRIIKWGAARAGVIVITPLLGSVALMANEVYMITRLADARGIELENGAIAGLIGSLGASFVGQLFFTIIPIPTLQIPVGVGITYALGKTADAWLKAGHPADVAQFREIYDQAKKEGMAKFKEFANFKDKDKPLGDEKQKFSFAAAGPLFDKLKTQADAAAGKVEVIFNEVDKFIAPWKEKGNIWVSAQKLDELKKGALTIPYSEIGRQMEKGAKDEGDIKFLACRYHEPKQLELDVEHTKYGILRLIISIEDFAVNNEKSFVNFKVVDFSVIDAGVAGMVLRLLGTKLIMSIINVIFNDASIDKGDFSCTYSDNTIAVVFTELVKKSKIVQKQIKGKNVLDLVQFIGLEPNTQGITIRSKFTLKNKE